MVEHKIMQSKILIFIGSSVLSKRVTGELLDFVATPMPNSAETLFEKECNPRKKLGMVVPQLWILANLARNYIKLKRFHSCLQVLSDVGAALRHSF
jgi:hypothetical protein